MTDKELKEKPLAIRYFDSMETVILNENSLDYAIERVFGLEPDSCHEDPYEHTTFDAYDCSFELKKATPGWKPTDEQFEKLFALGFGQCWICRRDETEFYRHSNGTCGEKSAREETK